MTAPVSSCMQKLASRKVSGSASGSGSKFKSYTCYNQSKSCSRIAPLFATMVVWPCDMETVMFFFCLLCLPRLLKMKIITGRRHARDD